MNLRLLGLLAVAAAALMAFAGTASATILTSPEGTTYTGEIVATSTNDEMDGAFVTVKCSHSEAKGSVKSHGGSEVGMSLSSLTFTGCNYHKTTQVTGSVTVTNTNGVRSTNVTVGITTSLGTCVFTTNETSIGTLVEGNNAFLNINSSKVPRTGGNFLCGSSGTWTGSYDLTTPNDLWVD